MTVSMHASSVESSERWNEDRDESWKWRSIPDNISHLAWCKFRKKFLGGKPIAVTLEPEDWQDIKVLLEEKLKKPIHPLYTVIYPENIANLEKAGGQEVLIQ